ncbi:MAG: type IV secretory system conjugative DNA transfer family protein, partial [Oscillospiraceae bacterium]
MKFTRILAFMLCFSVTLIILKFILFTGLAWSVALLCATCCGLFGMCLPKVNNLNNIKADVVGDGQDGSARFATEKEKNEYFTMCTDKSANLAGFVVGRDANNYIVDTQDTSTTIIAPPGSGKTKCIFVPSIIYNAKVNVNTNGGGASIIITDLKGEELRTTGDVLVKSGYRLAVLDFAQPLNSCAYNILYNINRYIDSYKSSKEEKERIIAYSKAERYAKVLAESIVDNVDGISKNEAGQYFTETAKGLITGMSLLVSEYGAEDERHILSVFRLIIELNGLTEESTQETQRSKLSALLEYVDNERIINYVGPAMSADVRSSMNIFSSALGKLVAFIDAELEQMLCYHSPELSDISFIENPTAIFIICPDENTTRHFFASLFIRYTMNDLIEQARTTDNVLKRKVLCFWDEFGNMPPIKNLDILLTAARSRQIRFLLALQSKSQLEKNYTAKMSEIVLDAAQCLMFTYVSPTAKDTARMFSDMLGQQTIKTGSVSLGNGLSQNNVNYQMKSRPLMYPDEIINMPKTHFII